MPWTKFERHLYQNRHFLELEHRLIVKKQRSLLLAIQMQETDLSGCRELHRGQGGMNAVIKCMHFINREKKLQLMPPGRESIIRDVSLLCQTLVTEPGELEKVVESKALRNENGKGLWTKCNEAAWKQVYLTTYANFKANPVGALAFLRNARASLGLSSLWAAKAQSLIK